MNVKTARRRPSSLMTQSPIGVIVITVTALLMWVLAVHDANFYRMGHLGLVTILHWPYFVGLSLVAFGFASELLRTPLRSFWLLVYLMMLALYLFGTACAVEPIAALSDSYRHSGLLQYILVNGHVLTHYVADFSWPGAFSLGSVLVAFAGQANPLGFTRWFPLFIELMYLAPLLVISRSIGVGRRAGWLGIALFYATDWIYQDYFSPQALGYLYLLITLAAVLASWRPKPILRPPLAGFRQTIRFRYVRSRAVIRIRRLEGHDALAVGNDAQTLGVLVLLGLIFFALAVSHELTPYALVLMLFGCLLTRRLGRPELVVVAALIIVGWLSLGATDYWLGHLNDIFGGFGQIGSTLSANVTGRVSGSVAHQLAVETRIMVIGGLYLLAGVGALRRSTESRALEVLAVAPFLLLAISSYVGEGLMRVVFYALPFTALLAASAIVPQRFGPIRSFVPNLRIARYGRAAIWSAVFVVVLGSAFATTVARGGNDAYESYSIGELSAANYVYDHAASGETVEVVAPYLPYDQRGVGAVYWVSSQTGGSLSSKDLRASFIQLHPAFIVLSQSQESWGEIVEQYPKGWENALFNYLVTHGFHVAASWPTATVLQPDPVG